MSLDLYLKSTKPVRHRGTGVWVRDNGCTRELKTLEEVKAHFPDADLSDVRIYDYEDDTLLSINLTHNLTEMAHHVPIAGTEGTCAPPRFADGSKDKPISAYNLLWHPEMNPLLKQTKIRRKTDFDEEHDIDVTQVDAELVRQVMAAHHYIANHREELEKYNPSNGWGDYGQLLRATRDLLMALLDIPVEEYSEYFIYCWV